MSDDELPDDIESILTLKTTEETTDEDHRRDTYRLAIAGCADLSLSAGIDCYCALSTVEERAALWVALGLPDSTETIYPLPADP